MATTEPIDPEPSAPPGSGRRGRAWLAPLAGGAGLALLVAGLLAQARGELPFGRATGAWCLGIAAAAAAAFVLGCGIAPRLAAPALAARCGGVGALLVALAATLAAAAPAVPAVAAWLPLALAAGFVLAFAFGRSSATAVWLGAGFGALAGGGLAAASAAGVLPAIGLPVLAAATLLATVAVATGGAAVAPGGSRAALVAVLAVVPCTLWATSAIVAGFAVPWPRAQPGGTIVVATAGDGAVHYDRASQELRLFAGNHLIDVAGPTRVAEALAATLAHALGRPGDRVLVLGLGSGRLARELAAGDRYVVDAVDAWPGAEALRDRLLAAGPVAFAPATAPAPLPVRVRYAGLAAACLALPAGARQLAVFAPQAVASGVRTDATVLAHLRAVVAGGPVLQVLALDLVPAQVLHELFAAAVAVWPWNGLFAVEDAAVLVSAERVPDWAAASELAQWPAAARWRAHRAHLGERADLQRALLGTLAAPAAAPELPADRALAGRAASLAVLRGWLVASPAVADTPGGVLLHHLARRAEVRQAVARIRALADDADAREQARATAARFLHLGAPAPELQAALGLPGSDGTPLLAPAMASRFAHALDPTFFGAPPPVCRSLPVPRQPVGDLEDLSLLPPPDRLAALVAAGDPKAVALRVRFPSESAQALVAALGGAPLGPDAAAALRELADPFVLAEAARAVATRAGERELLALWRFDLPMPGPLRALTARGHDDRLLLAAALRGRTDPSCHQALADLLVAGEPDVRARAAEALPAAAGGRVPYDPDWPHSARAEAAQRLRSLHNRAP